MSAIIGVFHRRRELKQLIRWARRKGLEGPLRAYQSKLGDEETRLMFYRMRSPHLVTCAYVLVFIHWLIIPEPRTYQRGHAAKFKSRSRTVRAYA